MSFTALSQPVVRPGRRPGIQDNHRYERLVQALADGSSLTVAAGVEGIRRESATRALKVLRTKFKMRTTMQLVAHYVRNGWID